MQNYFNVIILSCFLNVLTLNLAQAVENAVAPQTLADAGPTWNCSINSFNPLNNSTADYQVNYTVTGYYVAGKPLNGVKFSLDPYPSGFPSIDLYTGNAPVVNANYGFSVPVSTQAYRLIFQGIESGSGTAYYCDTAKIINATVGITSPINNDLISKNPTITKLDIIGSATGSNFSEYQLMLDSTIISDHIKTPVRNGVLAQINVSQISSGTHTLTLNVKNTNQGVVTQKLNFTMTSDPNVPGYPVAPFSTSYPIKSLMVADMNGQKNLVVTSEDPTTFANTITLLDPSGHVMTGWPKTYTQQAGYYNPVDSLTAGQIKLTTETNSKPRIMFTKGNNISGGIRTVFTLDSTAQESQPTFSQKTVLFGQPLGSYVALADVDGDSLNDPIVYTKSRNGPTIASEIWTKNFYTWLDSQSTAAEIRLAVSDIVPSKNGKEIIVSIMGGWKYQLYILTQNANGQGDVYSKFDVVLGETSAVPVQPLVGDMLGNGDKEVIFALSRNTVTGSSFSTIYAMKADGSFIPAFPATANYYGYATNIALAGFNNDKKLSVVFTTRETNANTGVSTNRLGIVDSSGQFKSGWPFVWQGSEQPQLAIGDIDGDGKKDIVMIAEGKLYVFNDDKTILSGFPKDIGLGSGNLTLTDLNGDGKTDIVFTNNQKVWAYSLFSNSTDVTRFDWSQTTMDATRTYNFVLPNQPPLFTSATDQAGLSAAPVTFNVAAADPEGKAVTLSARLGNGDALSTIGASFTDNKNGTGTFNWVSPNVTVSTPYNITFTAKDPEGLSANKLVTINVAPSDDIPIGPGQYLDLGTTKRLR